MNKKTLIGLAIGLLALTFMFLLISFFAAGLVMVILSTIFTVGSMVCLIIYLTSGKQ